jgi:Mn2+/Fe2+ NRAMP family transporter
MRSRRHRQRPAMSTADKAPTSHVTTPWRQTWPRYVTAVGPGMMAGIADNDPAGVATYAIAGAVAGYSQLWLIVLATFLVQAVQVTSARIGDVTQQGVLRLTRVHYGWRIAALAALVGLVANEATLIADVAALGASLELLTGLSWRLFVLPSVLLLLVVTVFSDFPWLRNIFLAVGVLLLAYVVTAVLVRPNWSEVLRSTFIPSLPGNLQEAAAAVALLGTTVSPYLLFWEAEAEREVRRTRLQIVFAEVDVTVGYVASNFISYCIVVTTAATLFVHHQMIRTAADAAVALQPLAGDLAGVIFAVGLLGTGLLAVPMFAISIGYIVAEMFDLPAGLSKSPSEAPGFYAALGTALLSGGLAAFLGVDPVVAMFDSQILDGLLMPVLIVILALLANDSRVMGADRNTPYYNFWLVTAFVVMTSAAALLVAALLGLTEGR